MANNNYAGILGYARNAINQTPEIRNNPQYSEMIAAIQNGDAEAGQRLANQILQQHGVSKGQALQRAFQFFGFDNN